MTDTYQNAIDIPGIADNWPLGRTMPTIIAELGALMAPWPWGALGHWRLKGEKFEEFWGSWMRGGAGLEGQFGVFMNFANGTVYAVWYHDDDPPDAHPVVSFGDEGEIRILASNIKTFFTEWASGRGIGWLDPFDYEASPSVLEERHAFGAQMLAVINAIPDPPAGRPIPEIQARLDKTVAASRAVAEEIERQKRLTEVYGDRIDLKSLEQFWPRNHPLPKLITELGAFMKPLINGSIGRFEMKGQIMPDTWFDHATELHAQFGFFLVDYNYRAVAVWYHDGVVPGSEPIVGFRSMSFNVDEDAIVLAPNLNAYVTQWAQAVATDDPSYGLNEEPELLVLRPDLSKQMLDLVAAGVATDGKTPPAQPAPDLAAFVRSHIASARARDAVDPVLQKMAEILRPRFPPPDNVIDWSIFVEIKGDAFELSGGQGITDDGFPERPALTPLLFAARAARVKGQTASLGPWKTAQISLKPDGRIALIGYWNE
jgi:hypothetical protein